MSNFDLNCAQHSGAISRQSFIMFLSAGVNLNSKTQKAQDIKLLQKIFSRVHFSNYLILLMEHIGRKAKGRAELNSV